MITRSINRLNFAAGLDFSDGPVEESKSIAAQFGTIGDPSLLLKMFDETSIDSEAEFHEIYGVSRITPDSLRVLVKIL